MEFKVKVGVVDLGLERPSFLLGVTVVVVVEAGGAGAGMKSRRFVSDMENSLELGLGLGLGWSSMETLMSDQTSSMVLLAGDCGVEVRGEATEERLSNSFSRLMS